MSLTPDVQKFVGSIKYTYLLFLPLLDTKTLQCVKIPYQGRKERTHFT